MKLKDIAPLLHLNQKSVRDLYNRGVAVRNSPSDYDYEATSSNYIADLKKQMAARANSVRTSKANKAGNMNDLDKAKLRLTEEQADEREIKNAEKRGNLIAKEKVAALFVTTIGDPVEKLKDIPDAISRIVPTMTVQQQERVVKFTAELVNAFCELDADEIGRLTKPN